MGNPPNLHHHNQSSKEESISLIEGMQKVLQSQLNVHDLIESSIEQIFKETVKLQNLQIKVQVYHFPYYGSTDA